MSFASQTLTGTRVGGYSLVERIGQGSMAEVFLARRDGPSGFSKDLVIKMILSAFADEEDFIAMFEREARLAARLAHSNIVQVFDFGSHQGRLFLVMELVRGMTLRALGEHCRALAEPIPVGIAARIVCGVCAGLHHAHELCGDDGEPLGLVHRDVAPENLMVGWDGQTKILDFGIAKAAVAAKTASGLTVGRSSYMSPERVLGEDPDRRADIYSIGVVLYEMLTGVKPFSPSNFKRFELLKAITETEPPELDLYRNTPPELIEIVETAMAKSPEDRFETARQMRVKLERFVAGLDPMILESDVSRYLQDLRTRAPLDELDETQPIEVIMKRGPTERE